jgi:hypothetical protein
MMNTLQELEAAVQKLSADDRAAFRQWFAEFDAEEWDLQLEADMQSGRLDWLIAEAIEDQQANRCSDR